MWQKEQGGRYQENDIFLAQARPDKAFLSQEEDKVIVTSKTYL